MRDAQVAARVQELTHTSADVAVLNFLRDNPDRYWSCFQLCKYTWFSLKAVNHACLYLRYSISKE